MQRAFHVEHLSSQFTQTNAVESLWQEYGVKCHTMCKNVLVHLHKI